MRACVRCLLCDLWKSPGHDDHGNLRPTDHRLVRQPWLRLDDRCRHICNYRRLRGHVRGASQSGAGMTRGRLFSEASFYLVVALTFVYIVFPFYWAFRSSITPNGELFVTPVHYWPAAPTFAHYEQVFGDGQFVRALGNSTLVAVTSTLLSLFIG